MPVYDARPSTPNGGIGGRPRAGLKHRAPIPGTGGTKHVQPAAASCSGEGPYARPGPAEAMAVNASTAIAPIANFFPARLGNPNPSVADTWNTPVGRTTIRAWPLQPTSSS